jgi:hypothetical protein
MFHLFYPSGISGFANGFNGRLNPTTEIQQSKRMKGKYLVLMDHYHPMMLV